MKKYFFLFLFIIFVSIFIGFHVYHDGNDEFSKILIIFAEFSVQQFYFLRGIF